MRKIKVSDFYNFAIAILSIIAIVMIGAFVSRNFVNPAISNKHLQNENYRAIQVNILNACGESGLASQTREYLRKRGFDVVEIGNFDSELERSMVIDRSGEIRSSINVAYALGIHDSLIKVKVDSNLFLQSTVVIGKDFADLKQFK